MYLYMTVVYSFVTYLGILRGQQSEILILYIWKWREILKSNVEQKMLQIVSLTICNHNFLWSGPEKEL